MVAAVAGSRASGSFARQLRLAATALALCTMVVAWVLMGERPASADTRAFDEGSPKVKVGWIGHVFDAKPSTIGLTLSEAKPIATDNSGNLVWAYGARCLLDPNTTEPVALVPPYTEHIDAFLLPQANLLMNISNYDMVRGYTSFVLKVSRAVKAPIAVIGIGSQVRFDDAPLLEEGADMSAAAASAVQLHPQQVAFLKQVEASGGIITTRGKFTAAIIEGNGLPPPLPLGCPSVFINHNPRLGAVLQRKWDAVLRRRDPNLRLAVTLPAIPGDQPYPLGLVSLLARRVLEAYPNSVVVLQTSRDEDTLDAMHSHFGLYLRPSRIRYFYDVESWIAGLKSCCDLVWGFRIHGTMAGVAAEVPGIVIARDFRIRELAEAMALPTVDMFDPATMETSAGRLDPDTFDLFDFLAAVKGFDGQRFDARRRKAAKVYSAEFQRMKLPLHPGVEAIAELPDT
ncbi:hypothetical protein CHLNCDRAFT_139069 [Chlorella variabilis]|uniref:Polysaccharide pyruvyl transferase domain-containing protein n=1 Tax=Chlorella variabilis TaxID=554065 RepID=E1ZPA5_CHLVA|nr:hypothetical protein CHLNCDRAFT_139069 [Chlorella variabilis]EFN52219.1 hypothetical protein CHLNCDRAFT_139069 [Chlorella variabilis]|eukprot:XP_005844321.1 hypothetical protein CHLNCDRAFT_139069 [Chlorella variabilis]